MEKIETIIVGGGQAGLATSYYLKQQGREHIIFEQAEQAGNAWRNDRWDSFTLVTPNWTIQLPGAHYDGSDPDGFLSRNEIVSYFERYIENFNLPVQFNTSVLEISPLDNDDGYQVRTNSKEYQAKNVVMATGSFQKPRIPAFSANIPTSILQLHSGKYRNPSQLPDGAVLIVGSAQSGTQIAEELYQSGRKVYLCVCSAPRIPRRYRGKDVFAWLVESGFMDQTPDQLPSPKARYGGNPHLSGKDGGRSLNLHLFAREGVKLMGRMAGMQDGKVIVMPDLKESLARVDKVEGEILGMIDKYIQTNSINAPRETLPNYQDAYAVKETTELDLKAARINSIIWAMGYTFDYGILKQSITDEDGFPIQQRGITQYPGLYFIGTSWMHKRKSPLLLGVGKDAEYIVSHLR